MPGTHTHTPSSQGFPCLVDFAIAGGGGDILCRWVKWLNWNRNQNRNRIYIPVLLVVRRG